METESSRPVDNDAEPLPAHAAALVARLAPRAFGIATGSVAALFVFVLTIVPAVRGEPHLASHVGLLSQYLYGFTVSVGGAVLGALYALLVGFVVGNVFARARNLWMTIYLRIIWRRAEHHYASDLLDI
jgi:hypothetical protein